MISRFFFLSIFIYAGICAAAPGFPHIVSNDSTDRAIVLDSIGFKKVYPLVFEEVRTKTRSLQTLLNDLMSHPVVVSFSIDQTGKPANVRILSSEFHDRINCGAVIKLINAWRFDASPFEKITIKQRVIFADQTHPAAEGAVAGIMLAIVGGVGIFLLVAFMFIL